MPDLSDIYEFLAKTSGVKTSDLSATIDIERDAGVTGDDFFDLAAKFSKQFNVDMSAYRWYFHHAEEPTLNPGALFFKPPYRRVPHIPVTPELLLMAANTGAWPSIYPAHRLPSRRYDILLTYAMLAAGLLALVVSVMRGRSGA